MWPRGPADQLLPPEHEGEITNANSRQHRPQAASEALSNLDETRRPAASYIVVTFS